MIKDRARLTPQHARSLVGDAPTYEKIKDPDGKTATHREIQVHQEVKMPSGRVRKSRRVTIRAMTSGHNVNHRATLTGKRDN